MGFSFLTLHAPASRGDERDGEGIRHSHRACYFASEPINRWAIGLRSLIGAIGKALDARSLEEVKGFDFTSRLSLLLSLDHRL